MRKFSQPQNPNPTDLRVQRRHKKRAGKVERDTARVFYMRLSQVRLKIQFNSSPFLLSRDHVRRPGRLEGVHQGESHSEVYGGSERLQQTKCWRAEQAWKKFERHPTSRSVREIDMRRHDGEPPTSPHFRCVQQIKLPEGGACSATEARYPLGQTSVAQQAPRTILTAPSTHQRAVWLP